MCIITGITVIAGNEKFSGFATTPTPPAGTSMEIIGLALGRGGGKKSAHRVISP
jgi:hypothetical protein